jgi:acetyl-CoA carboxylase carboxyl transferase subunit alpha
MNLRTVIIVVIIGEGGSGGALAMGIGDKILMLEHAIYSVISPEGCAAILWKDSSKAQEAAASLKLTAQDLLSLGLIDEIIKEPLGGAHRDYEKITNDTKFAIINNLKKFNNYDIDKLLQQRYKKFRRIDKDLIRRG